MKTEKAKEKPFLNLGLLNKRAEREFVSTEVMLINDDTKQMEPFRINVKKLSYKEAYELQLMHQSAPDREGNYKNLLVQKAVFVAACLCDENGVVICPTKQRREWATKYDALTIEQLFNACHMVNSFEGALMNQAIALAKEVEIDEPEEAEKPDAKPKTKGKKSKQVEAALENEAVEEDAGNS